ncbi:hypothetical protein AB0K40_11640 [Nonomuraea bangladeshensis]|uniref:Uncharacterized protein n=1 Tax=Nonomuraea bangladeshensis TaxID=404385 RepID=A0ABV3H0T8_9ACTN
MPRLAAADPERRLGATVILPGGPGNSGYLDPVLRTRLRNEEIAKLDERYDLRTALGERRLKDGAARGMLAPVTAAAWAGTTPRGRR